MMPRRAFYRPAPSGNRPATVQQGGGRKRPSSRTPIMGYEVYRPAPSSRFPLSRQRKSRLIHRYAQIQGNEDRVQWRFAGRYWTVAPKIRRKQFAYNALRYRPDQILLDGRKILLDGSWTVATAFGRGTLHGSYLADVLAKGSGISRSHRQTLFSAVITRLMRRRRVINALERRRRAKNLHFTRSGGCPLAGGNTHRLAFEGLREPPHADSRRAAPCEEGA